MEKIKLNSCIDNWHWSFTDKSSECFVSEDGRDTMFHPECSEGTACVRANRPLPRDGNYYYWEVTLFEKIYGTSVMVGICNRNQSLHSGTYCNLVGQDENGWSLSHRGHIWHNDIRRDYTSYFKDWGDETIGVLYDSAIGTLSFYRNDESLGVAFTGLDNSAEDLYPVIGSTALKTRMRLKCAYRGFHNLQDRCRYVVHLALNNGISDPDSLNKMQIPSILLQYINELSTNIDTGNYKSLQQQQILQQQSRFKNKACEYNEILQQYLQTLRTNNRGSKALENRQIRRTS